jgi:hypothetical protein
MTTGYGGYLCAPDFNRLLVGNDAVNQYDDIPVANSSAPNASGTSLAEWTDRVFAQARFWVMKFPAFELT